MKSCTFFGHRDTPPSVKPLLRKVIVDLIENHRVSVFYVGNHGAFDSMVYEVLQTLKERYPFIRCTVVLAYMPTKELPYDDTVFPEEIETTIPRFAVIRRNRWMVEQADYVITYTRLSTGGAAQGKRWAEKCGKIVITL